MSDETRLGVDDAETPVNPYSLLAAVNASSRSAHVAWLTFLGVMAYLYITAATVTHRDLLLNSEVTLPLLQAKIGLTRFFLLVPIVVVLLHAALLGTLALLARRTLEFDAAVRLLESTDQRSHPLRLELDSFFLVQAMAGPDRSRVLSAFLNGLAWITLLILPLALLLYMQIAFLPFHDAAVTVMHRLAVLADIVLLLLMGVFLARPETTYFGALWRGALHNPGSLVFGIALLVAAAFLSAFATVPNDSRSNFFIGADGALFGFFPRNLDVTDADLVGSSIEPGRRSIVLRGRDLRHARLDRTDLHQADLTGANLDGASLAGADLRRVQMRCDDRPGTAQLPADQPGGSQASCASARGANFAGARLSDADLAGVDMRGARFQSAHLDGAGLYGARMTGADFSRADLRRADLSGDAALQGANFEQANLQGADLTGAQLQMSDFSGASLQGAALAAANLEGASLREASLDAASLQKAKLFGADLSGASLFAADLSGAVVWRTPPPASEDVRFADMTGVSVTPPSEQVLATMRSAVEGLEGGPNKVRLAGVMAPASEAGPQTAWVTTPEGQAWTGFIRVSDAAMVEGHKARLTEQLVRLACRADFGDGAVAAGVVRRALAAGFKGDLAALSERLKAGTCPAAITLAPSALNSLAAAAASQRTP